MSDPRRLLDDPSQLSDEERELLLAGTAELSPPAPLGLEVWSGLAAKLPFTGSASAVPQDPGVGSGLAGGSAAGAHGVGFALLLKAALAVLLVGALLIGGRALLRTNTPSVTPNPSASALPLPSNQVVTAVSAAPPAVVSAAPAVASAASLAAAHLPSVVRSSKASAVHEPAASSSSAADASEESRVVVAARDALRGGNSALALTLLGQAQQRFGVGVLGQEREALFIEALAKSGQQNAARARGEAFLKNYAHSPYAARIRAITGSN